MILVICKIEIKESQISQDLRVCITTSNTGKWAAKISVNGKNKHIGLFDDSKEAAKAYNDSAIKYHGQFARLNTFS